MLTLGERHVRQGSSAKIGSVVMMVVNAISYLSCLQLLNVWPFFHL